MEPPPPPPLPPLLSAACGCFDDHDADDCWTCSNDDNPATAAAVAIASAGAAVGFAMIYDKEADEVVRPSVRPSALRKRGYSFLHSDVSLLLQIPDEDDGALEAAFEEHCQTGMHSLLK